MKSITLLILLFSLVAAAGQPILDQYVQMGLESNLKLEQERTRLEQQQLNVQLARAQFFPEVSFEASYLAAAGGRTIDFPAGDLLNPVYSTLNELSGTNNFPTQLENVSEQIIPNNFHDTRLQLRQPLFNSSIYYNHKAQEELASVQEARLAVRAAAITKEVKVGYFNYLKAREALRIYDSTEVLLRELLRVNEKLVRHGKRTEDAITTVTYELRKLDSERAILRRQLQLSKAYFNSLLRRELEAPIIVDSSADSASGITALAEWEQRATAGRQELQQLEAAIRANNLITELYDKEKYPTVGLQLNAGFQGFGYRFDEDQAYATLGLGLSWTLYSGGQRKLKRQNSVLERRRLQQEKSDIKLQIRLQVTDAWHASQAARRQLEAEQAALANARRTFEIVGHRYKADKALLVEYLDARTRFTNARIAVAVALYDVRITTAELEWAAAL